MLIAASRRCEMRTKILIGAALIAGVLAASTLGAVPVRRSAVVRFLNPTLIAGSFVIGTVVIEHDDAKMASGEPCTTVYRFKSNNEFGEPLVSFMCVPLARPVATKFEAKLVQGVSWPDRLVEDQIAGEHEGHGVPASK
jgi:hypothetical protein